MATLSRADRSRENILDAAGPAFAELGFQRTTMEEIARRAGVTRKTVYNLFASKDEIARQLIARVEAEPDASYRARIAAGEDAVALVERILLDSAGWCIANPELARLALSPPVRPALEPPEGRASLQRIVRDTLRLGQSQGTIRADEDANLMTLLLLGLFGQAMLSALAEGRLDEALIRRIVRLAVEGIGEWGG